MAIEICDNGKQLPIHQLNKLDVKDVTRSDIYPLSVIQAIFDSRTGIRLDSILSAMNFLYLPYAGSSEATRLQIPLQGRHRSLILSYIDYDKNVHIEQYVSDSFTDEQWQCKHNWKTPFTDGNFVVNVDDEKLLELLNNIFNEFKQTPEFINLITEKVRDWLTSSEGLEVIKESITRELDSRNIVYWNESSYNIRYIRLDYQLNASRYTEYLEVNSTEISNKKILNDEYMVVGSKITFKYDGGYVIINCRMGKIIDGISYKPSFNKLTYELNRKTINITPKSIINNGYETSVKFLPIVNINNYRITFDGIKVIPEHIPSTTINIDYTLMNAPNLEYFNIIYKENSSKFVVDSTNENIHNGVYMNYEGELITMRCKAKSDYIAAIDMFAYEDEYGNHINIPRTFDYSNITDVTFVPMTGITRYVIKFKAINK